DRKKILILAGMADYDREAVSVLSAWCASHPVAIIAENLANMDPGLSIGNPEPILAGASQEELLELKPDLVIGLGGQVVSKRLKNFIQMSEGISDFQVEGDPSQWIREVLVGENHAGEGQAGEESGSGEMNGSEMAGNSYLQAWRAVESRQLEKAQQALAEAPFGNLTVVSEVLRKAPPGTVVHLGNSATVRYSQLLPVRSDLTYCSNRGTSGIDGSVSAAAGAATVSDRLHLLVLGDLSFVYDSNALWNYRFPMNLRIVVINDGGGGIFRLLDGPDRMPFFEEYSVTRHPVSIELLSQAFGRGFQRVSGREELEAALDSLYRQDTAAGVLEVDTTGSENSLIFKAFNKKIE
ncbi:MAG: thiamine pyrophosphate-dependent enzyme, partial [Bacteroidales bacterium]